MKTYTFLINLSSFAVFDIVFIGALITACVYGYTKGFVRQLLGLVGIVAGTYCAYKLAEVFTAWWHTQFDVDPDVMKIIVFIILAIIIYLLVLRVAVLLNKLLKMAMLGWLNRLLGMIFGAAKIILIFSALAYAINALNFTDKMVGSKTFTYLISLANYLFPYINFLT